MSNEKKYKGMWKKQPKSLSKMNKDELISNLRKFRNSWEKHSGKNQDLSDERLKSEKVSDLRSLITYYYSDVAKEQSLQVLEGCSDMDSGKQVTKKFSTRPSPPYHANSYKNRKKKGNDGNWYMSVPNKNKVYRWIVIVK